MPWGVHQTESGTLNYFSKIHDTSDRHFKRREEIALAGIDGEEWRGLQGGTGDGDEETPALLPRDKWRR